MRPSSRTNYVVYESYNPYEYYEDIENDGYPTEIGYGGQGDRATPQFDPTRYGCMTPTGQRPPSQMYRPLSRTQSRAGSRLVDHGAQVRFKTDPKRDLFTPGMIRPAIERGATFAGVEPEMDPFTKNYYNRLYRQSTPSSNIMMNRMGRAGGKWRHITSCIANTGSHVTFVEGTVKQVDNALTGYVPVSTAPPKPRPINAPATITSIPGKPKSKIETTFNQRAKNNFRYWYQEPRPIDLNYLPGLQEPKSVASRLRLKARQVGLGY